MRIPASALIMIFLFALARPAFSEDTSSSYDDVEFPQWSKDLRRTEIITLGSVPFVTLWTTLGYSMSVYGEFRNPLSTNTDDFTESDKKKIIALSGGICVGLGLVDLIITLVKRSSSKKIESRKQGPITIIPKSAVLEGMQGENPVGHDGENGGKLPVERNEEYLIDGVIENAIF